MSIPVNLLEIYSGFLSAASFNVNNTLIEEALGKALNREGGDDNDHHGAPGRGGGPCRRRGLSCRRPVVAVAARRRRRSGGPAAGACDPRSDTPVCHSLP